MTNPPVPSMCPLHTAQRLARRKSPEIPMTVLHSITTTRVASGTTALGSRQKRATHGFWLPPARRVHLLVACERNLKTGTSLTFSGLDVRPVTYLTCQTPMSPSPGTQTPQGRKKRLKRRMCGGEGWHRAPLERNRFMRENCVISAHAKDHARLSQRPIGPRKKRHP
jgi:hypothetical protein